MQGQVVALSTLGIKTASVPETLHRLLAGPYGEIATRMPVQALVGSLVGAGTGQLADKPGKGAILGALSGTLGGLAVGSAPKIREALIKRLSQKTAARIAPILVRQRKDPFQEIHRRLNQAFKLKEPKFDISALLKRQLNNPFKQPQLQLGGKTPPLRI